MHEKSKNKGVNGFDFHNLYFAKLTHVVYMVLYCIVLYLRI